jgi:nucleoid-associated protein YgaU
LLVVLALGSAWLLASCATAPKPAAKPAPEATKPVATTPETPAPETKAAPAPVTALEFQTAEKAIADAEAAGADTYAPDLLNEARQDLADARQKADADPDAARGLLQMSVDKAHEARDRAWAAQLAKLDSDAQAAIDGAVAAGADTYAPDLLNEARKALSDARDQKATDPAAAKASYLTAIDKANAAKSQAQQGALTQLDKDAQAAIAEAEAVEADQYAPEPLNAARKALADGRDQSKTDPDAAKASFETSISKAHEARDAASAARTQALLNKLDAALAKWTALQPDRWVPDESTSLVAQAQAAKAAVTSDYATGLPQASDALSALEVATEKLSARLVSVQDLRTQAQSAMDAAEAADADIWVPDLVQSANDAFFEGTGAWKKYQLDAAEEAWTTALFQAKSAQGKAEAAMERKRTQQLMLDTMKKLEDASGKTVVDPQDNIIPPKPWNGEQELQQLQDKPVSVLIPADGSVAVLADVQRVTYLDQAKEQWVQGVKAYDAGDLTLANQCFLQSQKLIETYLAMAVDKIYTVRLIPDRRDSLWRISEYGEIYATPWDWPKIWKRNQKLIQNPDLIYPGWQLIIPPQ